MRRLRPLSILVGVLASAGAVSCAAVLGFERLSTDEGVAPDAASDATSDAPPIQGPEDAGADAGACGAIGIPAEPADAAAAGGPPILVALKLLDFGVDADGGAGNVPGFNLDRACSTDLASSTCKTNVLEPTFDRHAQDKTATGVDNAGYSLIEYISSLSDLLTAPSINAGIAAGRYGAILRITDWSGAAADDDVQVEIFPAIGLLPRQDPDAGFGPDDQWVLDARFQVAGGIAASRVKSDRAWVTGNQLVARFAEVTLPILIDEDPKPFDIHIKDVILAATLATNGGVTSLSAGTVSGRWATVDFLGQVRTIFVKHANGLDDTVLCEPVALAQLLYGSVKKEVCDARDIRGDSNDTAKLGCDAFSAAMRVEAYPVTNLGVFDAGPTIPPRCTAPGSVPEGDDCTPN